MENVLIAEFMGWTLDSSFPDKGKTWRSPAGNIELETTFKFHNDWNLLMPVIEKISKIEYERYEQEADVFGTEPVIVTVTAYPRTFGMITHDGKFMFRFNRCRLSIADTLIAAAWEAVVYFIKSEKEKQSFEPVTP